MNEDSPQTDASPSLVRPLLWVAMVAVAVRLPHLLETVRSVFFGVPILDEAFYDLIARRLAADTGVADVNPGFRSLLYPALLAVAHRLTADHGLFLAVAAQHLLGVLTCQLTALYAGRLWRRRSAALAAGIVYALAGPPLFYEGRLLVTSLFTFLLVALLLVAGRCRPLGDDGHRLGPWLAAGALVAIAAQARPNALALLVAFPLVALTHGGTSARRLRYQLPWLAGLASALAGLALAAAVQSPALGRFQLLPGAGGVNLYLGNERGADGMMPRQDRHTVYGDVYRDSVQLFAEEEFRLAWGRDGSPSEVSRYWLGRTLEELRADPAGRLALLARKVWLLAWPTEVPNNLSYEFVAGHESHLLRRLPTRWVWLLPLAAAGAWIGWRRRAGSRHGGCDRVRLLWLLSFGALHALGVVAFFVAGRYRIPLWPLAAILAAGPLVALLDAVRRRRDVLTFERRDAVVAAGLALLVLTAGQFRWPGVEPPTFARDFFYRSVARQQSGDLDGALEDARRAVELEPANPQALFQLGTVAIDLEDWTLAESALFDASRRLQMEPRPYHNLGIALQRQGRYGDAYAAYLRAIETGPDYSPAWVQAALLELRAGRADLAAPKVARAEQLEDAAGLRTVARLAARAFVERDLGRPEAAARAWAEALATGPEIARRLAQENARRLRLRVGVNDGP